MSAMNVRVVLKWTSTKKIDDWQAQEWNPKDPDNIHENIMMNRLVTWYNQPKTKRIEKLLRICDPTYKPRAISLRQIEYITTHFFRIKCFRDPKIVRLASMCAQVTKAYGKRFMDCFCRHTNRRVILIFGDKTTFKTSVSQLFTLRFVIENINEFKKLVPIMQSVKLKHRKNEEPQQPLITWSCTIHKADHSVSGVPS
jgi:hypothetical protein